MKSISDLRQLNYVFNSAKVSLEQAKSGVANFILSKKVEIFNNMGNDLKVSLEIDSVSDIDLEKAKEMVNIFVKVNP